MKNALKTLLSLFALLATLGLATPNEARAYALSCSTAVNFILYGDDGDVGLVVGHSAGVVDFMAGIYCFTKHRACSCLSNLIVQRTEQFSEAFAARLASCATSRPRDPAFGPAVQAAADVCGL
ncbi:MAG TPA: hypothetical protein VIS07_06205 [Candidatus Binatia bacterium]